MSDVVDHVLCVRAWGIPDRRVASGLAHENQAGQWRRRKTIGKRAAAAGWPVESPTLNTQRQATQRALRRLEGMDWSHRAQSRHTYKRRVAYESRSRTPRVDATWDASSHHDALFAETAFMRSQGRPLPPVDLGDGVYPGDGAPTIYDE